MISSVRRPHRTRRNTAPQPGVSSAEHSELLRTNMEVYRPKNGHQTLIVEQITNFQCKRKHYKRRSKQIVQQLLTVGSFPNAVGPSEAELLRQLGLCAMLIQFCDEDIDGEREFLLEIQKDFPA